MVEMSINLSVKPAFSPAIKTDKDPSLSKAGDPLIEINGRVIKMSQLECLRRLASKNRMDLEKIVKKTVVKNGYVTLLSLNHTQIKDISALKGLTKLEGLRLRGTQVRFIIALEGLTNLRVLDLDGTLVSDVSYLKDLTNLQDLSLRGTKVSDITPLKGLTNLHALSLKDTKVSDISPLKGLSSLKLLYLPGTVSREQVDVLKKELPKCEILRWQN